MTWCTILVRYIWIFACEVGRSDSAKISPTSLVQAHCPRVYLWGRLRMWQLCILQCSCSVSVLYCLVLHTVCSQAVVVDRTMYISGQIGMSPEVSLNCCTAVQGYGQPGRLTVWSQSQTAKCVSPGCTRQLVFPVTLLTMETHHIHSSNKSLV